MEFLITGSSEWGESKPCEEAYRKKYTRIDERIKDDPKKILSHQGKEDWWYEEGTNHRVENGHIKRDFEETGWFIEINTLDELLELKDKYDDLILTNSYQNPKIPEIEIYGYYRE